MNAEIVCVGTEILLGDIINTNTAFLAKELAASGINCFYQTVVGDNPKRLRDCLEIAFSRADLVITTGGLGPTYDDLTKETIASYFGVDMTMHQPSLDKMRAMFENTEYEMTPNNRKQTLMPVGSTILENDCGTAPGFLLEKDDKMIIVLPGPPREMVMMFENQVRPKLMQYTDKILVSRTIHLFGIGESAVETVLKEYMIAQTNPTIAPYAKEGEMLLRVTASAKTEDEAHRLIEPVIMKIDGIFSKFIYGLDVKDLQTAVVQKYQSLGKTLATAESCTGGLLSKRITDVPGSSAIFGCGICAYSNEIKQQLLGVKEKTILEFGAVSKEVALEMAQGVLAVSTADIAIGMTGVTGPDGGTGEKPIGLVYIAIVSKEKKEVKAFKLARGHADDRERIRYMSTSHALALALAFIKV